MVKIEDRIRIAIVGYGNIGKGVQRAIEKNPDMTLAIIASRRPEDVRDSVPGVPVIRMDGFEEVCKAYSKATNNGPMIGIDVAILCGGSAKDLPVQGPMFAKYMNTVDSFDTHKKIPRYFNQMDRKARSSGHLSLISMGWDPGTFSLERVLGDAFIPGAKGYTFWGPGVSQGHSDAVRKIKGVVDARQYTIPKERAIEMVRNGENPDLTTRQKHKRVVYVVAEKGADRQRISKEIKTMPDYFRDYDTTVHFISADKMRLEHYKYPHGGLVLTSGNTGNQGVNKAAIQYHNEWGSNPEATANILVAGARAVYRMNTIDKKTGAITLLDIPPAYLSPRPRAELLKKFM